MTSDFEFPDSFLRRFQQYYDQRDIVNHWAEPTEESPYPSLILRFEEIGERNVLIDLELCFVPGLDAFSQEGIYILQSFAVLHDNVPASAFADLLAETASVNITLSLGAFGLFSDTGTLYFKHNTLLSREVLDSPHALQHLDRQNALILHQFHLFADRLLDIAERIS
jgi:hypothetical protein